MTLEGAAAYLKVSTADVEAAINAGDLKARKIGSQYRIAKEAIDAFLAS
ncbi:MAG: helix-turn-helix domain-containing protein [Caldilinea sp.]